MSGWIKWEKDLKDDPRVIKIASRLRNAFVTHVGTDTVTSFFGEETFVALALGGLSKLWSFADTHVRDDDTIELGIDDINKVVGIKGFAQMLPENWLQILDPEAVKLPKFHKHNGTKAKKKALTQKRVAKHRENVTLDALKSERKSNADVTPETLPDRDRDQTKTETQNKSTAAAMRAPTHIHDSRETDPDGLLDFKLIYPDRAGDQNWRGAHKGAHARLAEGHTHDQFLEGARRYAEFCRITGKIGTEYTMQASRFLGPGKPFLLPWDPPKNKAEARLDTNISEMNKFLSEGAA